MARETCPAMLMMTSSPAPDAASSVTSVWRLSCHRPFTPAFWRTLLHAVLNDVIGRVGSLGRGVPKANTNHSGRHSRPLALGFVPVLSPPATTGRAHLPCRAPDRYQQ